MKPRGMDRLHRALLNVSDNAGNEASANWNFANPKQSHFLTFPSQQTFMIPTLQTQP